MTSKLNQLREISTIVCCLRQLTKVVFRFYYTCTTGRPNFQIVSFGQLSRQHNFEKLFKRKLLCKVFFRENVDKTKKMRWTTWISGFIIYCVLQWISFKIWILLNQEYNGDVKQGLSRLLPSKQGNPDIYLFFLDFLNRV